MYSKAIELNPTVPAYYCNRALAYLKTESYGYALADANKSIALDPSFVKVRPCLRVAEHAGSGTSPRAAPTACGCVVLHGRAHKTQAYYRRATAYTALLRFSDALRDYKTVCTTPLRPFGCTVRGASPPKADWADRSTDRPDVFSGTVS